MSTPLLRLRKCTRESRSSRNKRPDDGSNRYKHAARTTQVCGSFMARSPIASTEYCELFALGPTHSHTIALHCNAVHAAAFQIVGNFKVCSHSLRISTGRALSAATIDRKQRNAAFKVSRRFEFGRGNSARLLRVVYVRECRIQQVELNSRNGQRSTANVWDARHSVYV